MITLTISILVILVVVMAKIIIMMAYDKSYGCLTRAAFDILYPILKFLGYSFIAGDIDGFKQVNKDHGHEGANKLIFMALKGFIRTGDLVFRIYSGDEFMIAIRTKRIADINAMMARVQASFINVGLKMSDIFHMDKDLDTTMLKLISAKNAK